MITYWKTGQQSRALYGLVNSGVGQSIIDVMDLLARNAYLATPFKLYTGGASSFGTLDNGASRISKYLLDSIHLGMMVRNVATPIDGSSNEIVCLTSPGVTFDLQQQSDPKDWLYPMAYADPNRLLRYEVGTYRNVRFAVSPRAILYNCGAIKAQVPISASVSAMDGAPDPSTTLVDDTFAVGEASAVHYVQLAATDSAGATVDATYMTTNFKVNDEITIHTQRTNDFGVTNGVDYRDGKSVTLRVAAIDGTNRRLSFVRPVGVDLTTNLGGGVYGYVTKAEHVHSAIFLNSSDAIVAGVAHPPRIHNPVPVDDFQSIYRVAWDARLAYVNWQPQAVDVVFTAASYRNVGDIQNGYNSI